MSAKHTWLWILAAALLGGLIVLERHARRPAAGPPKILPGLEVAAVTSVQVRPPGPAQLEIRAERTNGSWRLTAPLAYPAQTVSIERLLAVLHDLTPAFSIPAAELMNHPKADEEYGLGASRATSLIVQQGDARTHLLIGARTAPGDQVYLQIVGADGAFVVDADLLKALPRTANDWRDTTFVKLTGTPPDRVAVTNNLQGFATPREATTLALQRDAATRLWRMVRPMEARADTARVEEALGRLEDLRVQQFVSDDPKPDLEALGLQPPSLEIALSRGSNLVAQLQFGRSPTNDPGQVFARCAGQSAIVTVSKELLAPWRVSNVNDFREPRLLVLTERIDEVEAHGEDAFSLQRQTNDTWRILPHNWPADATLVRDLVATLGDLPLAEFSRDIVTAPDLPEYGLATPARRFVLKSLRQTAAGAPTNLVIADLSFGFSTNHPGKIFARRTDENSVYAISTNDFQRLPWVSWQVRDRKFWNFSEENVASVTIRQQGKQRQIIRKGSQHWSLAPGSPGVINDLALDATIGGLIQFGAAWWEALGEQNRARLGFTDNGQQITIELKNGERAAIEFGGRSPAGFPLAATTLDGQLWILGVSPDLNDYVVNYLSIP
jgi:hypothetical protein